MAKKINNNTDSLAINLNSEFRNVYVDCLVRFALGQANSRLEFGVIKSLHEKDNYEVNLAVTIPTHSLLEAIPKINEQLLNKNVRKQLIEDLRSIADSLESKDEE